MRAITTLAVLAIAALGLLFGAPTAAQQTGLNTVTCNRVAVWDGTGGSVSIAVAAGNPIYVCGYILNATAGATRVQLRYGTGTTCGTGTRNLTPNFSLSPSVIDAQPFFRGMFVPRDNDLCIEGSATISIQALIYYAQNP